MYMGTKGGLNATHLMLLRENSRAAWLLMSGDLYSSQPPPPARPKVWVPSTSHPIEDALLQFAILGARVPEVRKAFRESMNVRSFSRYDIDANYPKGLPKSIYAINRQHLKDWHIVISLGDYSLARHDIKATEKYSGVDIEVRRTTHSRNRSV